MLPMVGALFREEREPPVGEIGGSEGGMAVLGGAHSVGGRPTGEYTTELRSGPTRLSLRNLKPKC